MNNQHKKSYATSIKELSLMLMYLTRQQEESEITKFLESSWKGYEFDVLNHLEQEAMLWQPRNRKGYDKYIYLTEEGREKAKNLLKQYGFSDKPLTEQFEFRPIKPNEVNQAVTIEQICFPPHEACSEKAIKERVAIASDIFLVALDKMTGKIAGFLNGIATDDSSFRDEFFKDASLHKPEGQNIMLLGLDVLPEYRGQGLAHEIVYHYLRREHNRNRKMVILTCLKEKVKFYKKMGFIDCGLADSDWGGEQWHEMTYTIKL